MGSDVPVVGVAGFSKAGKTTFVAKLVAELKGRGYRVGVLKHTHLPVSFDQPDTDTWRHTQAGADVVALAAPGRIAMFKNCSGDPAPEEALVMFSGVDLIIIEGYKKGRWPKLELYQAKATEKPGLAPTELLAIVSDAAPEATAALHLGLNDVEKAADLVEMAILGR